MAGIDRYYVGQGEAVLYRRTPAGGREQGRLIGNAPQIQIMGEEEELKHRESRTGARKVDNKIVWTPTVMLTVTFDDFSKENLAWLFEGTDATIPSGSVTGEIQKFAPTMQLNRINVTAGSVLARKVGAPSDWAANTYTVQRSGLVNIVTNPPAVGVVLGDDIQFNYSHGAFDEVRAFTQSSPEYWFSTHAVNKARNDEPVVLDCFRVVFRPNFQFDLIGEDYGTLTVEGELLLDDLQPLNTGRLFTERQLA